MPDWLKYTLFGIAAVGGVALIIVSLPAVGVITGTAAVCAAAAGGIILASSAFGAKAVYDSGREEELRQSLQTANRRNTTLESAVTTRATELNELRNNVETARRNNNQYEQTIQAERDRNHQAETRADTYQNQAQQERRRADELQQRLDAGGAPSSNP